MPGIEVDTRAWPILRLKTHSKKLGDEDVTRFAKEMSPLLERREVFVTILDNTSLVRLPSARNIRAFEGWVDDHRALLEEISCGTCTIAKNPLARGFARFLLHQRRPKTGGTVVGSMAEAVEWCTHRLRQRGVQVDEGRAAHLLGQDPGEVSLELEGGALDEERRAQVELVMSAFGEPAFLVDTSGVVLFQNGAARDAFERPPAWIASTVALGHDELKARCRVVPLDIGRAVALLVPAPELVPQDGDGPRVALPESLARVGALLALGLSDKEIAHESELALSTVRTYVSRIFKRTGVHSRGEFMRRYSTR